ncbi:DHBP synthase RibB-like alpha/beta domain-containing protein [Clohesyomyces aquaticus]|uniref:Threonylcarbamoyl-AMP synthase n=1 Tax=Clohesyomyces aquaticus TaxID=1231657 RepID=A0A1Y1ZSP0_9PLEO|nr:DHBP synthase RibB-like alpha/beta domain-containing protein [Clohesyomyces aquaticus]
METNILPVDAVKLGKISVEKAHEALVGEWHIEYAEGNDLESMRRAARELATTDVPVAFPTETVYGLGADATRSTAVRAIFAAKGRPADNPLIVHVCSISQLRSLLAAKEPAREGIDPIPDIYKPLIKKFWPGPLTLILPNPRGSVLAPEVTAGLDTFGARMPRSILALALIKLAGVPLAAPSANASTRPSPTAAEHVKDDLEGRIHTIIDGGPCEVGVESTVVDGLSHPPAILRPGGITVEQLRQCPGWEDVVIGYKDSPELGLRPKAPGMKYRHYSPKATVVLYEAGTEIPDPEKLLERSEAHASIGFIRTKRWPIALGLPLVQQLSKAQGHTNGVSHPSQLPGFSMHENDQEGDSKISNLLRSVIQHQVPHAKRLQVKDIPMKVYDVHLGGETSGVARGLFSALRELDKKGVDIIYVEGVDDKTGDDIAAAVMNRLRKAAEIRV